MFQDRRDVMEMNVEHVLIWLSANWLSLFAVLLSLIAVVGQIYNYRYTVQYTKRLKKQEKVTEFMRDIMELRDIVDDMKKICLIIFAMEPSENPYIEKAEEHIKNLFTLMEGDQRKVSHLELEILTPKIEELKRYVRNSIKDLEQKSNDHAVRNKQPDTKP
jgi:hypothetical protein